MKLISRFLVVAALAVCAFGIQAKSISILIVDGQNNHNWKAMTPFMKNQLEKTGMYTVAVSTSPQRVNPPRNLTKEQRAKAQKAANELNAKAWAAWNPNFAKYDVVISNYNGQEWPKPV